MQPLLGKFIRSCRKSKNMTLKQAGGDNVSSSMLSRFESGSSDISTGYFLGLLQNLNLTLADVDCWLRRIHYPLISNQRQAFYQAKKSNDHYALVKFYNQYCNSIDITWQYYGVIAHLFLQKYDKRTLDYSEMNRVIDYLASVEIWSEYEFYLFMDSLMLLPENTINFLVMGAYEYVTRTENNGVYELSVGLIRYYLGHQKPAKALNQVQQMQERLIAAENADISLNLCLYKGISLIVLGEVAEGKLYVTRALSIAKVLKMHDTLQSFYKTLNIYLPSDKEWLKAI
ncbi:MAG TPA: hypothetical protein K8U88_01305 [Levilactobacillus hammesii]|uniref:HTH cro/C1-type domain-containing protein n=1 Tax=Levilactobacillus hammesii TaxID=267633 RepID=A0A921JVW1_9LACO|nr:hypothetical protein [Levilactobacillus hammesii]